MMTNVTGSFQVLAAELRADEHFSTAEVHFSADVNSVSTGNEQRDGHLRSDEFFASAKFPVITFKSTNFSARDGKLHGDLMIRGIARPVTLEAEFNGIHKDPWGNVKAGFSLSGKINRKDWGLTWNAALEGGGLLVSEDVKISAEVQFVKQA